MDKISRFFGFLGQHDALIPYILNFNKDSFSFSEFATLYDPEDFISCAFIWSSTPQGFHYWANLSDRWRQELYSLDS